MTLRIGSLFSGVGGLDRAVADVFDAETVWFVEYEPAPARVLAHHYPQVPNLGDVTHIDWHEVGDAEDSRVDILTAGYP